jgi:zinc protease
MDCPEDYLETYRENIDSITADDVQRVAKAYIHPDKLAMVIVGDAKEILPQAKEYAEQVEVLDTEGNPKK